MGGESLEGWTIPIGHWDFEVFGAEGSIKGMNNGVDWSIRKAEQLANKRIVFREAPYPPCETRSATVVCLEDIVKAVDENRTTLGNVKVTHQATELCLAVAESHRQGGVRVKLPLENRDLYVWHV